MKAILSYLRIFILSFGMLHLQMLPVYAQADLNMDNLVQQQNQESQNSSQKTASVKSATGEDIGGDVMGQLINMITMMSIGMLGMVMYTYTPLPLDMKVAAAAAVAYIYGEVAALKATRDKMKSKEFVLTKYSDGTEDNMQRKALEEQKKSYESLAEMLDQKAQMQKVAAAGFLVAAGIAAYQKVYLVSLSATCLSGTTTAAATATSAAAACVSACAPLTAMAGFCNNALAVVTAATSSEEAVAAAPQVSLSNWTQLQSIDTTIITAVSTCPQAAASCSPASAYKKTVNAQSIAASTGASFVVGGIMQALGLGSLSGLTFGIFGPLAKAYDLVFATPIKRAIAFGALGGLIMGGASQSEGLAEKMRSNVQKIDELLRQMQRLQNVQAASLVASTTLGQDGIFMAANRTEEQRLESKSTPCPDGKPRDAKGACTSLKSEINTGIKESLSGVDGLPEGFISSAGQIGAVADDMLNNGGLTSGSLDSANNLLANSNAINNLNRRLREDINKRLKGSGLNEIDFDKEQNKFAASLKKAVMKGLDDAKSQDGSAFMAALGSFSPSDTQVAEQEEGEQLIDATSVNASVADIPSFEMPSAPKFDFGLENDEFNAEQSSPSALAYNEQGEMQVNISEDYETSESSEIVSNKDVSIFRVISVRYLKSGIPRLIGLEE